MLSIVTSGNEIDLFLPEGFFSDGYIGIYWFIDAIE